MTETRPLTEHVSGLSPLKSRAIDGSPRRLERKPPTRSGAPKSSASSTRYPCPKCEFVTADLGESRLHLYRHLNQRARPDDTAEEAEERAAVPIGDAVTAYLATVDNPGTARVYSRTLHAFATAMADEPDLLSVTPGMVTSWFTACWGNSAGSTWNRNLSTMRAAAAYWSDQRWTLRSDLTSGLSVRPKPPPRACALTAENVAELLSGDAPLRDRALWAILYEAAAAPTEVLTLNVDDLDMSSKAAITKAGEIITWGDTAAALLAELVKGRRSGPVFLTDRRSRVPRVRGDVHRATGRGRLGYRQALDLFKAASGGATLDQLRHAGLSHTVKSGATIEEFLAKSRGAPIRELARYLS